MSDPDDHELDPTRPTIGDPRDGPADDSGEESMTRAAVRAALFPSTPPPRLGKYAVRRELGRGALGVVYQARDEALARDVAIKVLRTPVRTDPRSRARVLREARALAALAHPNVVHVYEIGEADDQVFVVMELVPGRTLGAWLEETTRSWREIVAMFVRAGEGLVAAHAAGLVHRDFKPDNVLVGEDERPRVVDFGLARDLDTDDALPSTDNLDDPVMTATGVIAGTPAYMAPEVMTGAPAGPPADQFSFCVALYEALYGRRPFAGPSFEALRQAVLDGELEAPATRDVPRGIATILERGLHRTARMRYESMDALLAVLRREIEPRSRALAVGLGMLGLAAIATAVIVSGATPSTVSSDDALPWQPTLQRLTKTPGASLSSAAIDPGGETLAYQDADGVWLREVAGGTPRRLAVATSTTSTTGALTFDTDGALWLTDADGLRRVGDPGGDAVMRTVAEDRFAGAFLAAVAAGPVVVGVAEDRWWRLDPATGRAHDAELAVHPSGLAVSPDGRRIALRTWDRQADHEDVVVLGPDATELARGRFDSAGHEGLAWVDGDRLAALGGPSDALVVRCLTIDGETLSEVGRSDPVPLPSGMARAVGRTDAGALLLTVSTTERDVLVGRLNGDQPVVLRRIAPGVDHGNAAPAWIDAGRLSHRSRQHLRPTTMAYDVATGRSLGPLASGSDDGIGSRIPMGDGRTLGVRSVEDTWSLVMFDADGTTTPIEDEHRGEPPSSIRCDATVGCVLLRRGPDGARFDRLAPGAQRTSPGAPCPSPVLCMDARFSLGPDGRVLVPTIGQDRVHWLDPERGTSTDAGVAFPADVVVQSATALDDGAMLATIMNDGGVVGGRYALLRLAPGRAPAVLWSSDETWIVGAVVAPDRGGVAVSGIEMKTHAALLQDALAGCRAPSSPNG